jgi:hypothetical protein
MTSMYKMVCEILAEGEIKSDLLKKYLLKRPDVLVKAKKAAALRGRHFGIAQ